MSTRLPSGAVSQRTTSGPLPSGAVEIVTGGGGGGDTDPPILTFPTGTATGPTTADGAVITNEAGGTLYRLASVNPSESAATIKAAALTTAVAATGSQPVTFTGLTAATVYYTHFVQIDAAGNESAVADAPISFTTAGGAGTITTPPIHDPETGQLLANAAVTWFCAYDSATQALVLRKTGLTTSAAGIITTTDAALVSGTVYRFGYLLASGHTNMPAGVPA